MQLNIDKPCSENWDKMIPNDVGRHCSNCDKTVVDIRFKSNLEIKSLVETSDSVCAIANKHQLYNYQYVRPIKRLAFALLIVFGNALFSISASAQETTQQLKETYLKNDSINSNTVLVGSVVDEKGEPVIFANVILYLDKKKITGATTSIEGKYKIGLDESYTNKELKLEAEFIGYDKQVKTIIIKEDSLKNDFILKESFNLIGEVEIITITKKTISRDPSNANKTTFSKEEIQHSPNR